MGDIHSSFSKQAHLSVAAARVVLDEDFIDVPPSSLDSKARVRDICERVSSITMADGAGFCTGKCCVGSYS